MLSSSFSTNLFGNQSIMAIVLCVCVCVCVSVRGEREREREHLSDRMMLANVRCINVLLMDNV